MYSFAKEQRIIELGHFKIGGQPGELPTVLFGTVFYGRKFRDMPSQEIKALIEQQASFSDLTGNPAVVDVFIAKEEQIAMRLDLVLDTISDNHSFSIDVPEAEVRIKALEHLHSIGVLDRTIYNSLNLGVTKEEVQALKEHTPKSAVVLGYNPRDLSTDGRINIIENGSGMVDKGLMPLAQECGIENMLMDTAATPFEHMAGETVRAVPAMKNKWGYPVGCSIHNMVESWLWLKEHKKEHPGLYEVCDIGSNGLIILLGADFSIYGPITSASKVFPFAAMVDKVVSEGAEEYFAVAPPDIHPRSKLP